MEGLHSRVSGLLFTTIKVKQGYGGFEGSFDFGYAGSGMSHMTISAPTEVACILKCGSFLETFIARDEYYVEAR